MDNEQYIEWIEERTDAAYELAEEARSQGRDPEEHVDVPVAEDLAAKAESLVSGAMYPQIEGSGIKSRIRELEGEYGKNDERVAFVIGKEIAQEEFIEFEDEVTAIDAGLRVGLAYMTGGIVTAPLEGIAETKIRDNDDGSRYLSVYYAGPIRSAGGTASAMSVLLADYIRKEIGLAAYVPREEEVERYAVEVEDYINRVTKKQYTPDREETKMIADNVPVEINGTPSESIEVSNHKDLERVETNTIRGGLCLIYLDGLPLKASKIKKRIDSYGEEFGIEHWRWIEDYLDLQHRIHSEDDGEDEDAEEEAEDEGHQEYEPSDKFLGSMTGGRPVFAHHGEKGGFRVRYGRARTGGLAATNVHPATMEAGERFMAVGTQVKMEYPGKGTVSVPCDTIQGPLVRLEDGDVVWLETREQAQEVVDDIDEIIFVGDILVPYGEFLENGKDLVPSPYVEEWWAQEAEAAALEDMDIAEYTTEPYPTPSFEEALEIAEELDLPLHPHHTLMWHHTDPEDIVAVFEALQEAQDHEDGLLLDHAAKDGLEELYVPHRHTEDGLLLDDRYAAVLQGSLDTDTIDADMIREDPVAAVEESLGVPVRDQAPVFIGSRMGRPEKAERRKLDGDPMMLFPCGKREGGSRRNLIQSYQDHGEVSAQTIMNVCSDCDRPTPFTYCPYCGGEVEATRYCSECDRRTKEERCSNCGSNTYRSAYWDVPVKELLNKAKRNLDMHELPDLLKSVRQVTGKLRHVEPLEKGLLRQQHDLYVNKDGTVRHDSTDVPLTHFRPEEIDTDVETLREMGYTEDVHGEPLEDPDQMLMLKPQDIVISRNYPDDGTEHTSAASYMYETAEFVDDLLEEFYGLDTYYDIEDEEDLVGSLVIGLAPHTSGGIVGRIIGFTAGRCTYAHPYWHAAKRRNCDGDEDSIILLMDALLNFSRQFLPDQRGTRTMDAPLILSTALKPDEVDDESWNVDVQYTYDPAFYEQTQEFPGPKDVDVEVFEDAIEDDRPFESGFTHDTASIEEAPMQSNYTALGDMAEKVNHQLELGRRTRAVRAGEVAELVIDKHFIPDIKGNLNAFSSQEVRCNNCNEKYRRVPLAGRCTECKGGGKLLLTIYKNSIRKYLEPSLEIAEEYDISTYKRQEIMILKRQIQSLFGKEHKQQGLDQFT